jgi:hypothetical protein
MKKKSEILDELQTISPFLANLDKTNVLRVDDDYFEALAKRIIINVLLDQNKKHELQHIPEGYFDGLSDKILSKIRNAETAKEEINNISPVLSSLKDKSVFTVPENYFKDLNNNVLIKINDKKAKVISINTGKNWWRYTAAALVVGVIMISSLLLFNKKTINDNDNKFSTASANMPDYIKLSFQYKTHEQLENGISSLSDADIVNFLQQHGNVLDDELITDNIDTKELPDAADYLINDNTLDNFLKMSNAKTENK